MTVKRFVSAGLALAMLPVLFLLTACGKKDDGKDKEYSSMQVINTPAPTATPMPTSEMDANLDFENDAAQYYEDTDEGKADIAVSRRTTFCYLYETSVLTILDCLLNAGYKEEEIADYDNSYVDLGILDGDAIIGDFIFNLNPPGKYSDVGVYKGCNEVICLLNGEKTVVSVHEFAKDFLFARVLPDDALTDDAKTAEKDFYGYQPPFTVEITEGQKTLLGGDVSGLGAVLADHYASMYGKATDPTVSVTNVDTTSFQGIYIIDLEYPAGTKTVYYYPDTQEFTLNAR